MKIGLRPSAIITFDNHALNRNLLTGEPDKEVMWTPFDYSILFALQTLEDMVDDSSGLPYWISRHPNIRFKVTTRYNEAKRALAKYEKGRGESGLNPGEEMVLTPYMAGKTTLPTFQEWLELDQKDTVDLSESLEEFPENGTSFGGFEEMVTPLRNSGVVKGPWVNPDLV